MAVFLTSGPAVAQENQMIGNWPAEKFAMTPGGVDLRTGRYAYSATDLAIGSSDSSMKLTRIMPDYAGNHANPFGSFSSNWDVFLLERPPIPGVPPPDGNMYRLTLHMGGRALTFDGDANWTGTGYKGDGPQATLTAQIANKAAYSVIYTAQLPDGTVMTFRPMGWLDCAGPVAGTTRRCAFMDSMTQPDGTTYTLTYAYVGGTGNTARLKQVVSSRGFALLLEGTNSIVTKACVLNLATTTIPGNGLCPSAVPTATYTYTQSNTKLASATDPTGAVSQFTYVVNGTNVTMGFIKPGDTNPYLTNYNSLIRDEELFTQEITVNQTYADGRTYAYAYGAAPATQNNPVPALVGGTATDQAGKTITYQYDWPIQPGSRTTHCVEPPCQEEAPDNFQTWTYQQTPGPILIEDQLGRQTIADYCDPAIINNPPPGWVDLCAVYRLVSFTDPEGIKTAVEWDGYGNVKKATQYPKPGSGLTPIVTEAAYATTNLKTQSKPLWMKDGKGNQTDYTYDSNHGGVLTETGPAVNGIRPQKRYGYAQRYAWISNGAGGYVQAATPVWLRSSESFCKTSAWTGSACTAGASDEVVTSYDYGPNSGPNNLWLRGQSVTADGVTRRTCFAYDGLGRKISETTPNANLASCP
jgi:YD repeat-containing protein